MAFAIAFFKSKPVSPSTASGRVAMVLMMSLVTLEPVASSWLMKTIFSVFEI